MFTDSHCHLNFPELAQRLPDVLAAMQAAQVTRALCISTTMEEFPAVRALAAAHPHIWASVGVHPDSEGVQEPAVADLLAAAALPRVVAVGETGLDYYQLAERKGGRSVAQLQWQRDRFARPRAVGSARRGRRARRLGRGGSRRRYVEQAATGVQGARCPRRVPLRRIRPVHDRRLRIRAPERRLVLGACRESPIICGDSKIVINFFNPAKIGRASCRERV